MDGSNFKLGRFTGVISKMEEQLRDIIIKVSSCVLCMCGGRWESSSSSSSSSSSGSGSNGS